MEAADFHEYWKPRVDYANARREFLHAQWEANQAKKELVRYLNNGGIMETENLEADVAVAYLLAHDRKEEKMNALRSALAELNAARDAETTEALR